MTTHTRTFKHFVLNDSLPKGLAVRCTSPPGSATPFFSVIADYGWAETILCSGSYQHHANSIAAMISDHLDIPVALA